jgi:hypothetical protein
MRTFGGQLCKTVNECKAPDLVVNEAKAGKTTTCYRA